jgi:hypothetical protein
MVLSASCHLETYHFLTLQYCAGNVCHAIFSVHLKTNFPLLSNVRAITEGTAVYETTKLTHGNYF